ncbi:hypothetical protein PR048_006138 [Dryococelus australis]|uniref:Uncharacterized protein n=1 Tax=Dryococelus australis TaxID=614101 RepID=A0ABQ9IA47_9NEOP|nr:hypothetical protein PR048_006138 [Dryococelus australis]
MPLVGGSSRGYPASPAPSFRCRSIFTSIALIDSKDLAIYSLLCVISQYQEYKAGRGTAEDDYFLKRPMRTIEVSIEQRRNARKGGNSRSPRKPTDQRQSSGTIPTCRPGRGIEPGSPWWEASRLTAQPPWLLWLLWRRYTFRDGSACAIAVVALVKPPLPVETGTGTFMCKTPPGRAAHYSATVRTTYAEEIQPGSPWIRVRVWGGGGVEEFSPRLKGNVAYSPSMVTSHVSKVLLKFYFQDNPPPRAEKALPSLENDSKGTTHHILSYVFPLTRPVHSPADLSHSPLHTSSPTHSRRSLQSSLAAPESPNYRLRWHDTPNSRLLITLLRGPHVLPPVHYSARPTATSCLSTRRAVTCQETRASPTQSPTAAHSTLLGDDSASSHRAPSLRRNKHVQFPDQKPCALALAVSAADNGSSTDGMSTPRVVGQLWEHLHHYITYHARDESFAPKVPEDLECTRATRAMVINALLRHLSTQPFTNPPPIHHKSSTNPPQILHQSSTNPQLIFLNHHQLSPIHHKYLTNPPPIIHQSTTNTPPIHH